MAPGLFALGITLASDRERGLLELKRALPMPPRHLSAREAADGHAVRGDRGARCSWCLAATARRACRAGAAQWSALFVLARASGCCRSAPSGCCVGALAKASAAPAVLNLIYLPMSFLSGLWVPLQFLPHSLAGSRRSGPAWHLAQLAQAVVGTSDPARRPGAHLLVLRSHGRGRVLPSARRALGAGPLRIGGAARSAKLAGHEPGKASAPGAASRRLARERTPAAGRRFSGSLPRSPVPAGFTWREAGWSGCGRRLSACRCSSRSTCTTWHCAGSRVRRGGTSALLCYAARAVQSASPTPIWCLRRRSRRSRCRAS